MSRNETIFLTRFPDLDFSTAITTIKVPGGSFRTDANYRGVGQGTYFTESADQAFKAHQLATELIWEAFFNGRSALLTGA